MSTLDYAGVVAIAVVSGIIGALLFACVEALIVRRAMRKVGGR